MKIRLRKFGSTARDDEKLSNSIVWMTFMLFFVNFAYEVEELTGISQDLVSTTCKFLLVLYLCSCISIIIRGINLKMVLYLVAMIVIFIFNYLASSSTYFIETAIGHLEMVLPMVVVVCVLKDYSYLLYKLTKISYFIILLSIVTLLVRSSNTLNYAMGFANALTLPVVMMLYSFYAEKRTINLLFAIIGTLVIVIMGSRGALLGIGVFEIIILLRGCKSKKNRIRSILIILAILVALFFMDNILMTISSILGNKGWSSRTIWILLNDFGHDSGRNDIYQYMINELSNHPFKMHGIAGERLITNGAMAHNMILELMIDFGIIIGSIIVAYILFKGIKTIINAILFENRANMVKLIFFSVSLPLAFFSGTIWTSTYLWMWLFLSDRELRVTAEEGENYNG